MDEGLKEFEFLWTTQKDEWVLVPPSSDPSNVPSQAIRHAYQQAAARRNDVSEQLVYRIVHPRGHEVMIIEDDGLEQDVIRRMIEAGVPIVNEADVVYEDKDISEYEKIVDPEVLRIIGEIE